MVKNILKSALSKLGFVVHRKQPWMDNFRWLEKHQIKTVLDIGANEGLFAMEYAKILPEATIYSFEPIQAVFERLKSRTSGLKVKVFNYGLGDVSGKLKINVNQFSPSSSILELSSIHKENYGFAVKSTEEEISIKRLDEEFAVSDFEKNLLVKIDVQGFEDKVLNGADNILANTRVVYLEMTFRELYSGQKLFHDLYTRLYELGFDYQGSMSQNYDVHDGSVLYEDAVFVNRKT